MSLGHSRGTIQIRSAATCISTSRRKTRCNVQVVRQLKRSSSQAATSLKGLGQCIRSCPAGYTEKVVRVAQLKG